MTGRIVGASNTGGRTPVSTRDAISIQPAAERRRPGSTDTTFEPATVVESPLRMVPRPVQQPVERPAVRTRPAEDRSPLRDGPTVGGVDARAGVQLAMGFDIPNPIDVIDGAIDGVKNLVGDAFDAIKGAVVNVAGTVVEFAKDGYQLVKDGAQQLVSLPIKVADGATKTLQFALDAGVDVAKWVDEHKTEIAMAVAVAALVVGTGGTAGIALAGVAGGLAAWSVAENVAEGNYGAAAFDVVLALPGVGVAGRMAKLGYKLDKVQDGVQVFRKAVSSLASVARKANWDDAARLTRHHADHAKEFGANLTEAQYRKLSIDFVKGKQYTHSFQRPDGDFVMFDKATGTIAVMRNDGVLRTFFKPAFGKNGQLDKAWAYYQRQLAKATDTTPPGGTPSGAI